MLRSVYEGPGSHGILRLATSIEGVHAVLRAYPDEGGFPALYAAATRTGKLPAFSLSPVREHTGGTSSWGSGDLSRDLSGAARRGGAAEVLIFARSEAALLAGEGTPVVALPGDPETGRTPKLVTCEWESPGVWETQAADLALLELVKAHAEPQPRSPTPTVNILSPPVFGPNASAEAAEIERVLGLVGIGINARVSLETSVEDPRRLPQAWANVVLYRETAQAAALYLQDEFGTPRVTTPPVGSVGTGAVLRATAEACSVDPKRARRAAWAELARTAKLSWYARLAAPETFRGRRAALFGDLTYTTGLGYTLAREIGLEVAWAGTYLTHLEKDFLFRADTFTDEAFVTDEPETVATRIKATAPDLLVGTRLEAEVAEALGIPFLPLCPPVPESPFVERPLMGYAGTSVLADTLDLALRETRAKTPPPETRGPAWAEEALAELEEVPVFLRGRTRRLAEKHAQALGSPEVTPEILDESRS